MMILKAKLYIQMQSYTSKCNLRKHKYLDYADSAVALVDALQSINNSKSNILEQPKLKAVAPNLRNLAN